MAHTPVLRRHPRRPHPPRHPLDGRETRLRRLRGSREPGHRAGRGLDPQHARTARGRGEGSRRRVPFVWRGADVKRGRGVQPRGPRGAGREGRRQDGHLHGVFCAAGGGELDVRAKGRDAGLVDH